MVSKHTNKNNITFYIGGIDSDDNDDTDKLSSIVLYKSKPIYKDNTIYDKFITYLINIYDVFSIFYKH